MNLSNQILRALRQTQSPRISLDDLCDILGLTGTVTHDGVRARKPRREEVRAMVRRLDDAGLVDASRLRLTLEGFAVAMAIAGAARPQLRLVRPAA
jgi:hypothetical protein